MVKVKRKRSGFLKYLFFIIIVIIALELSFVFLENEKVGVLEEEKELIRGNVSVVKMYLPAVDVEGNGVTTLLVVEAYKGTGRTLVDIENLLFWADTQQSIRMARLVASNYTTNKLKNYNLIYNVEANASIIGGPSAGAAITIATIFALQGEEPRKDVIITGTINHDGSIGPVSGILEKAKASKEANAKIFLVPLLQSRDVIYETKEHCEKFGIAEICTTETIPKKIDVAKEAGINVTEVSNIEEALKYFKNQ